MDSIIRSTARVGGLLVSLLGVTGVIPGLAAAQNSATASISVSVIQEPHLEKRSVKVGKGLYEVVSDPDAGLIYVAAAGGRGDSTAYIYALDAATLETRSTIETSRSPQYGLAINRRTKTLYGTNTRGGDVVVTDIASGKITSIIKDPNNPKAHLRQILVDEETNRIYATAFGKVASVWVIDGNTNTLERVIENTGNGTMGIALDKEKNRLYVTNATANEVGVIDLESYKLVDRYPSHGDFPMNLLFDPATRKLFVPHLRSGIVTVMHADSGKVTDTIATGKGALSLTLNPNNNRVYVANREEGTVTIFDANSLEIIADVTTGTFPQTIAIDSKTNTVFVTNKARGAPRGQPPVEDPNGDTVTRIVQ